MSMYWIIFIGFALLSWLVSSRLQNKFEKYSKIPMPNGMTGKDVAEKMLHDNGIYDVKVISTPGHLTDHYNPANQTVNLSESVYYSNSIAAAAVAAHECVSPVDAVWYYSFCIDDFIQFHYATGRDQCQPAGFGMVEQCRHHKCLYA